MRYTGNPIYVFAIIGALAIYLMLRTGGVWLPTGRVISKFQSPRTYWLLIGASLVAVLLVTAFAIFQALPTSTVHGH